jgi:predicted transcriptional regulator
MEAVVRLIGLNVRRLLVTEGEAIVGVLREQDVFFEMANIVKQITVQ